MRDMRTYEQREALVIDAFPKEIRLRHVFDLSCQVRLLHQGKVKKEPCCQMSSL